MSFHKLGYILLGIGAFIITASLSLDLLSIGKGGIGGAQIYLINIGTAVTLFGIGLAIGKQNKKIQCNWLEKINKVLNFPNIIWVISGFSISYFLFMISPIFFASTERMAYFNKYLPDRSPIGIDFISILASISNWFEIGSSTILYPPLLTIIFAPLSQINYPLNYYIITTATIVSFFIFTLLLPFLIVQKENQPIVLFIFGTSIFSYGLQFELERGQFHTIAIMLCLLSVYLFHKHPSQRFFAYIFFCVSVQFKIYPALFFVLLVDDWRNWKENIKRFFSLGIINFLLLFLLGFNYFSDFLDGITQTFSVPSETWNGNHSINAFVDNLLLNGIGILRMEWLDWVRTHDNFLKNLFLAYFLVCFFTIWINSYRRNKCGIDSTLLMACVMGGLLIPTVNHDYTLPLLAAPFILVVSEKYSTDIKKRLAAIVLLVISSFVYFITLLPFIYKPEYLQNSFPLLIILLTASTLLSFLVDAPNKNQPISNATLIG